MRGSIDTKQQNKSSSKKEIWKEMNVVSYIQKQIEQDTAESKKTAETLVKDFKLSPEKYSHIKARAYIKTKKWTELKKLIASENTGKKIKLPYDYIFELLENSGDKNISLEIAKKAPFDVRFDYYVEHDMLKEGANLCFDTKNKDKMRDLQTKAPENKKPEMNKYISDLLTKQYKN